MPKFFKKMKKLSIVFLLFVGITVNAQTSKNLVWHKNIEKAIEKATKENKKTLVYFSGSDWCKPCMELKNEVFATDLFKQKAKKDYVLVNIDFILDRKKLSKDELTYIEKAAEKYNKLGAFPLVVVLNEKGEILTSVDGYKSETASYYIENYLNN